MTQEQIIIGVVVAAITIITYILAKTLNRWERNLHESVEEYEIGYDPAIGEDSTVISKVNEDGTLENLFPNESKTSIVGEEIENACRDVNISGMPLEPEQPFNCIKYIDVMVEYMYPAKAIDQMVKESEEAEKALIEQEIKITDQHTKNSEDSLPELGTELTESFERLENLEKVQNVADLVQSVKSAKESSDLIKDSNSQDVPTWRGKEVKIEELRLIRSIYSDGLDMLDQMDAIYKFEETYGVSQAMRNEFETIYKAKLI